MHAFQNPLFAMALVLAGYAPAQAPQPDSSPSSDLPVPQESIFESAVGLSRADGETWGIGPDYRVQFRPEGPEFSPVGSGVLRLRLAAVHRGGTSLPIGPAELVLEEETAVYRRPDIEERYEMRSEGMEQSFVIHRLPPGRGDLVVALQGDTDLAYAGDDGGPGIELRDESGGGIRIGEVTVIDARGSRTAGRLRWQDSRLELVAPAAFVESAALPILVDPLLGSVLRLGGSSSISDLEVAYEPDGRRFLVVWSRRHNLDDDILAQMVSDGGSPIGGVIPVAAGNDSRILGGVCTVDSRNAFVVTWTKRDCGIFRCNDDLHARAVSGRGALGPTLTVADLNHPDDARVHCIAGSLGPHPDALIAWANRDDNANTTTNFLSRLRLNTNLSLTHVSAIVIPAGGCRDLDFALSRTGGTEGRYLLAWSRCGTIRGSVIDRQLNVLSANFAISLADGHVRRSPVIDGDGTSWLVAYDRPENRGSSAPYDVRCRRVVYNPQTGLGRPDGNEVAVARRSTDERTGDMARLRESYLLCISDDRAPVVLNIDPANCLLCERRVALDGAVLAGERPAVATTQTGSMTRTTLPSMIVWRAPSSTSLIRLRGQLWEERDGVAVDLGGGCGSGGEAVATCIRVGNLRFAFRLRSALPSTPAFLMVGLQNISQPCSGCTWRVDPLLVMSRTTSSNGTASGRVQIPNDPSLQGVNLLGQWALLGSGLTCMGAFDLSNALRVVLQQ